MPKLVDHEERRAEIAKVVIKTIATHGMQGTTIRSVSRTGGFSSGVLAHYFSSKESMIDFAFGAVADAIMERVAVRLASSDSGREQARAVLEEFLPLSEVHGQETSVSVSFWNEALHNPNLRPLFSDRYGRWRTLLETILRRAIETSELVPRADVEEQVDVMIAAVDGLAVAWMIEGAGRSERRARAIDAVLSLAGSWR